MHPDLADGINEISPASPRSMALARACPGRPSEFSICFSDEPANNSPEVLTVGSGVDSFLALSGHGPCLVGGIITLDDAFFTTEIVVYSGANALTPFGCVAFLDTASPQPFIRRDGLDSMLSVGAHPPRANGHALLDPGVVFANLALCKFRQASA